MVVPATGADGSGHRAVLRLLSRTAGPYSGEVSILEGREVVLGGTRGLPVIRTLPHRDRRMVGAWCFVDQYGPHDVSGGPGMVVPPHPHTGLQTVSWLLSGEVRHTDSVGSDQLITPGQLNLMTAGEGIWHAEVSPGDHSPTLHGVQLWVALPDADRHVPAHFENHPALPVVTLPGATATVVMGELAGVLSPGITYTPIVAADVVVSGAAALPARPGFEYAALHLTGAPLVDGEPLPPGALRYLDPGRDSLPVGGHGRLLLLGGEPFAEQIVMWWNFVGRSHEEIAGYRERWMSGLAPGHLPAPRLPETRLVPRGRVR
jgi:redox-sensitive bicupin YhaK (pirin superfamily)